MKVLKVKNSWFKDSDLRLDAKCHLSEGRVAKVKVLKSPYKIQSLVNVTKDIYNGARFKRYYVEDQEKGIPFMGSSDMLKSDLQDLKLISKKHSKNLDKLMLEEDWILVSCSGTIGNTVYTNKEFLGKTASQHIMRIIPNENIKSGFLYAYLSSIYGYHLLTQGTYGAVIQHIEPHHIENLPVPIFPDHKQLQIHELIVEASDLRYKANNILEVVINELESNYVIRKRSRISKVSIKKIFSGDKYTAECRLESDYYSNSVNEIEEQIKKTAHLMLGDVSRQIHRSGLRERKFVSNNGVPMITGQDLNQRILKDLKQLSKKFTRNIEKNTTKNNDILISVQGTIGKVEYVLNNQYKGVFASEQLSKIEIDENLVHPGYVFAFLKSKIGQILLNKYKTGSIIEWIKENNIASVLIPIPSDLGKRIGEEIDRYIELLNLSITKENQAIALIEKEIDLWQVS
jgi:type I restriction enzyme, S subunit